MMMTGEMVWLKKKVTLGNERVSWEIAGWNAFSLWPSHKIAFRFQLSHICFETQVFMCPWKVIQFSVIMWKLISISPKLIYGSIFVYLLLITLNQRLLASILQIYHDNFNISELSVFDDSCSETKINVSLSNLTVAEKMQHTVSQNVNVMPLNVCDTSTPLRSEVTTKFSLLK